jgi:hypothetical protein
MLGKIRLAVEKRIAGSERVRAAYGVYYRTPFLRDVVAFIWVALALLPLAILFCSMLTAKYVADSVMKEDDHRAGDICGYILFVLALAVLSLIYSWGWLLLPLTLVAAVSSWFMKLMHNLDRELSRELPRLISMRAFRRLRPF